MNYFGLDIGHSKIKLVFLEKNSQGVVAAKIVGETVTPASNWRQAGDKGLEAVANSIKVLLSDLKLKTKECVLNLPEDEVVSRLVKLPPLKENEIQDALLFEAETFVPYPLDQASLNYEIVNKDEEGKMLIFAVAVKSSVVEMYVKLCKMAGLLPIAFETTALALRNMFSNSLGFEKPIMAINLGEQFTDLIVLRGEFVYSTRSLAVGGEAFTRAISVNLGLDMAAAEEYKKAYGMRQDQLEGKIKEAVSPVFGTIAEEVRKALVSFNQDFNQQIELLCLSGGGGSMPGLAESFTKTLGIEVQVLNPFVKMDQSGLTGNVDQKNLGSAFGVVTGLALREII